MNPASSRSSAAGWAAVCLAATLAGCAGLRFGPPSLPPGTTVAEAIRTMGRPTAEYRLPDSLRRLEYWGGSFGKSTYMLDFDANDRLVGMEQVLTERNFYALPAGITQDELLARMGPPSSTFAIPRQHIRVWNYRYDTNDCLWFQVSIGDDGRVAETTRGIDPSCDPPNDPRP